MTKRLGSGTLALLPAVLAGIAGLMMHQPPSIDRTQQETGFSVARAYDDVKAIAQKPRPIGSPENAAAADYIASQITAAGGTPEFQEGAFSWYPGCAGSLRNVLARIEGKHGGGQAVALVAHYDSVPFGPGAADDATGVAALLETYRVLKAGPPLDHDIIFIFTDGEEGAERKHGLRGAHVFARQHPWVKNIRLVLNFDCRGTRGPSYMYETSPGNGFLVRQMARAGCRPFANSIMADVSGRMPTGSDFTAFTEVGLAGLNFAFINGLEKYHTALDNPENLNQQSLLHHGLYALQLARQFGNADLLALEEPDQVFFNFGTLFIHYPGYLAWPLTAAGLVLAAYCLHRGLRTGAFTWRQLLAVSLLSILQTAAVIVIAVFFSYLGYSILGPYVVYRQSFIILGSLLFATGVVLVLVHLCNWRFATSALAMAGILLWATATALVTHFFSGASWLVWPLFLAIACTVSAPRIRAIVAPLAVAAMALLMIPIFMATYEGTGFLGAPVLAGMLMLLLAMAAPLLERIPVPRIMAAAAIMAAIGCFGWAFLGAGFDAAHPKGNSLTYGFDADAGKAYWLSSDTESDEWTHPFFFANDAVAQPGASFAAIQKDALEFYPLAKELYAKSDAPLLPLEPPLLELKEDVREGSRRRLYIRLQSPRHAARITLSAHAPILETAIAGVPVAVPEGPWRLTYENLPAEPIELMLLIEGIEPIAVRAIDHSYGLPSLNIPPRPPHLVPKPNTIDFNRCPLKTDETVVAKSYTF